MEHFNENVEASELQTSNDVPVDLEPSDEALEQDSQELEQPPESQNNNWLDSSDTEDDPEESADDYPLEKPEREYPEEEELEFVDLNPDKPKAESSEDEESAPEETKPEALEDEELEFVDLGSDEPKAEASEDEELTPEETEPEDYEEDLEIVDLDSEEPEAEVPEEEEQATVDSDSDADDDDSDAVLRHDLALRQYPPEATEDNDSELRHPDDQHKNPYLVDDSTDGNNTQQDLSADLSETESESDREQGTLPDLNETVSENRTGVFPGHNKFRPIDTTERHTNENPEPETTSLEDLDSQALSFDDPYSGYGELDDGPRLRNTLNPQKAENTDNQPAIENRGGRYGVREGLAGVEHKPIEPATVERSEQQIISSISGGDMTEGSCSSLALAYAGNKAGYVVHDFRDGQSREFFSSRSSIEQIANMDGVDSLSLRGTEDTACAQQLMSTMQPGKEYYMATGGHASVVRLNDEGRYEYLELQSGTPSENGWHPLTLNTLYDRFGCEDGQSRAYSNYLIDLDSLQSNPEFLDLLGYLNTDESAQMKGSSGYVR